MKKRILSLLVLTAQLLTLAACGSDPAVSDEDTTPSDTTPAETTLSAEESRLAIDDGLPQRDFGGHEFKIMTYVEKFYWVESETGEVLNDAKYKRQQLLNERFNIDIQAYVPGDFKVLHSTFMNSVMADDNSFDIAVPHQIQSAPAFVSEHLVGDWNDVPYIDLSKPWWTQTLNDTVNILDHQFFLGGYMTLPEPFCLYYNKSYIEDYKFEDLYTLVTENRWTMDVMMEMCKTVSEDLNGDSVYDAKDQWGLIFNDDNHTVNFMYAAGHMSVALNEDKEPVLNVNNEKMLSIVEKVYDLAFTDNMALLCTYNSMGTEGNPAFNEGRAFLKADMVGHAASLRNIEFDFGLVPFPMFEENQEGGYQTHVDAYWGMICLPINAPDKERTGIITEALAAETYKRVIPAFYEKSLGDKFFRDAESVEMMDIIFDGIVYDFGYVFDNWKGCTWILSHLIKDKSKDLTSRWASVESTVVGHYNDLYEAVSNYDN